MPIPNRELSQFGSFLFVDNTTRNIGIATSSTPYVGIGTTNPQYKLHVAGDVQVDGDFYYNGQLQFGNVDLNTSGIITASAFYNSLGQQLVAFDSWSTAGSNIYRISGNVGVGTSVLTSKLTVLGDVTATNFVGNISGSTNLNISGLSTFTTGPVLIGSATSTGAASQPLQVTGNAYVSGNLGIGTTNPETKLQINGVLGFGTFDNSGTRTNIRIGDNTTGASITDGYDNIFMGIGAGNSTTSGTHNNFFGRYAGRCNTTGSRNNFLGRCAGRNNTTGCYNNFFGQGAGYYNTTGFYNNFLGSYAGNCNTTGSENNFFGPNAGFYNTTGGGNNFFGVNAGESNTTGCSNNFFGVAAGRNNTTGTHNTFLGAFSGISTSASNKVVLGRGNAFNQLFDAPDTTKDTQFAVGVRTDANPSKYWLVGNENFNIGIGTTNPTSKLTVTGDVLVSGVVTCTDLNSTSDINLKTNIKTIENSLNTLSQLRGVSFDWKENHKASYGVIAQELEKVLPELVTDTDPKTVNYNGIIGVLIEAVKELRKEVEDLKNSK